MISAAIYVLAFLAPDVMHTTPPGHNDPFRGSQEAITQPHHSSSRGMTLDVLQGLPRFRPSATATQPQVWMYQPPIVVYPTNTYGLGGYRPPGVGGRYRSWGMWWFR